MLSVVAMVSFPFAFKLLWISKRTRDPPRAALAWSFTSDLPLFAGCSHVTFLQATFSHLMATGFTGAHLRKCTIKHTREVFFKVWGPNVNSVNEATHRCCRQEVVLFVAREQNLKPADKNSYQIISVLLSLLLGAEFSALAKVKLILVLKCCCCVFFGSLTQNSSWVNMQILNSPEQFCMFSVCVRLPSNIFYW